MSMNSGCTKILVDKTGTGSLGNKVFITGYQVSKNHEKSLNIVQASVNYRAISSMTMYPF